MKLTSRIGETKSVSLVKEELIVDVHLDYIEKDGYVWRYNEDTKKYYNTGICLMGKQGNSGPPGRKGDNGLSAYLIAREHGFDGNVQAWLDSLKGKSAYEIAVENGFEGTVEEWLDLIGEGKSAYQIWQEQPGNENKSIFEFLAWMKDTSSMIGPKYAANTSEAVMINNTPTLYYIPNGSTFDVYLADEINENAKILATDCPGATQVANNFVTNKTDVALSAKMGKQLKEAIDAILSSLGEYAFPNGKPIIPWDVEFPITEVEYLESDGNQIIDTGLVGNLNTDILIKFMWVDNAPTNAFLGSRGDNTNSIQLYLNTSNATQRFGNKSTIVNFSHGVVYTARINKTALTINGTTYQLAAITSFVTPTNIFFFGNNQVKAQIRIYNVQITQDNTLVRNFVPVKRNNVGYMRDIVNGILYSNAGDGAFTIGPEVSNS